jgi:hypothetical protein
MLHCGVLATPRLMSKYWFGKKSIISLYRAPSLKTINF